MNTITSTTVDLRFVGSTVADTAASALMEMEINSDFLSDESHVLWLHTEGDRGIGVQRFGVSVLVTPGYFDGELLYSYGTTGSEAFQLSRDDAQKIVARVIRRANKLEIYSDSR